MKLRNWSLFAGAVVAILPSAIPRAAHASVELGSSMSVSCSTLDCTKVRFHLDLASPAWVSDLDWRRLGGTFTFTDASGAVINNSRGADWRVNSNRGSGIQILSSGGADLALAPIWFELNMGGVTSAADLLNQVSYVGNAYENYDEATGVASGTYYSFGGTVTPEPVSMVLLGSGLAGIAGVSRRRRRKEPEQP